MRGFTSLKALTTIWVICSFGVGLAATATWMHSTAQWDRHLQKSYIAGLGLFETLEGNSPAPQGISTTTLTGPMGQIASAGHFSKLPGVVASDFVTILSLRTGGKQNISENKLSLALISSDLIYPIAKLGQEEPRVTSGKLADVTQMLASYCSNPIIFAQYQDDPWLRIDGNQIWGCEAAPLDLRLGILIFTAIAIGILMSFIIATCGSFQNFAKTLSNHGLLRSPKTYDVQGPDELRLMIGTINGYLKTEEEALAKRATFLSGVSHDLGTPATRLRLRAEEITNKDLRLKVNKDIDQMTSMIESVLSYTQSELRLEELRELSLISLVEAVVDDFQDAGQSVQYLAQDAPRITAQTLLFKSAPKSMNSKLVQQHGVVIQARPLALRRALTNLIDNAQKYGRKAEVRVEANSQIAAVHIDDYGDNSNIDVMQSLTKPFERGVNAQNVHGFGIGLSIASTIAAQHGGHIEFNPWSEGMRVTLTIPR